jgi:hypothetical protein
MAGKGIGDPFADVSSTPSRSPLWEALAELGRECPAYVPADRRQRCLSDGRRFLAEWANPAEALGWSAMDVFGLIAVPVHPSFRRLSRYDELGLCWLLDDGKVLAMTEGVASIETRGRARLRFYRRISRFGMRINTAGRVPLDDGGDNAA